jgi:hypothetical protein
MKALIQKKQEIAGSKDYREIKETIWYFLCIPIFYSKAAISR